MECVKTAHTRNSCETLVGSRPDVPGSPSKPWKLGTQGGTLGVAAATVLAMFSNSPRFI